MIKKSYGLWFMGYGKQMFLGFVLFIILLITHNSSLVTIQAQEISPAVKKNVIQNYKVNLSDYLMFGTDCSLKPRGDANCDKIINQFDLSIWEIEFSATNSPKRSDFNNDGIINLLDYGIWRNTFYPLAKVTEVQESKFLSTLINLISNQIPMTQLRLGIFGHFLGQLDQLEIRVLNNYLVDVANWIPAFARMTVSAQERQDLPPAIDSSQAFTFASGNSFVVNSGSGTTQQTAFDINGNPVNSQLFDGNGQQQAGISFLDSGTTVINTQQDGVQVQINKTALGAVIEFFRNPDGSLLAAKSWPTQASYDVREPPLSVTVPGQGNIRNVFNIQPNGDSILEKNDIFGNILNRNQIRSNGTLVSEDFLNQTIVTSNSEVGFTNLTMDNNLGGKTEYMFYKGSLYAITQTNSSNEVYIAKPLDKDGNSWSMESTINNQKSEKTVAKPITELNSNTPDPKELIQYINYYKSVSSNNNAINFSDGFPSSARSLQPQITKANQILTISNAQAPAVLGIIKEAYAQTSSSVIGNLPSGVSVAHGNTPNQYQFTNSTTHAPVQINTVYTDPNSGAIQTVTGANGFNINTSTWTPKEGENAGKQVSAVTIEYFTITPQGLYEVIRSIPVISDTAPTTQPLAPLDTIALGITGARPVTEQTTPAAQPAAPAAPAPLAPGQVGALTASQLWDAYQGYRSANPTNPLSLGNWLQAQGNQLTQDQRQETISVYGSNPQAQGAQPNAAAATNTPTSAAIPAGAVLSTGIAAPTSGFIAGTTLYSQVSYSINNQTGQPYGQNIFKSEIRSGGPDGPVVATQFHNPVIGLSTWEDDRGRTTTLNGSLIGVNPAGNPYAPGTIYALNTNGDIVAMAPGTGFGGSIPVDTNGRVPVGFGRSLETKAELDFARAQLAERDKETGNTTGKYTGVDFNNAGSTCFLPGTLISTPNGLRAIETLKPGDKVYSFNEKTGEKEISDFSQLDINFDEEYLVINGQIRVTVYHRFYTKPGNSFILKRADALNFSDLLLDEANNLVPVRSIQKVKEKVTVYNLLGVTPNNNYFAEGILVHNEYPDTINNPEGYQQERESWAANNGWNPSVDFGSSIDLGHPGGTTGDGGSGKAGAGSDNAIGGESGQAPGLTNNAASENQPADDAPAAGTDEGTNSNPNPDFGPGNDW